MTSLPTEAQLEMALNEATMAMKAAQLQKAQLEVEIINLSQEIGGLQASLLRRRNRLPSPSASPIAPLVTGPARKPLHTSLASLSSNPEFSPSAGGLLVAGVVVTLIALGQNWADKKRASSVELVLQTAKSPIHRTAIHEILSKVGRHSDSLEDVSAALAYLHRCHRAIPVGDGFWKSVDQNVTSLQTLGTQQVESRKE